MRTQDLTPPTLSVVDAPPPGLTDFTVVVQLDEPGEVFAAWWLASDDGAVGANATCPPAFQVGVGGGGSGAGSAFCLFVYVCGGRGGGSGCALCRGWVNGFAGGPASCWACNPL